MRKTIFLSLIIALCVACQPSRQVNGLVLVNHLGYQSVSYKSAVLQTDVATVPTHFTLLNEAGDEVFSGKFTSGGQVENWHTGKAYRADFTDYTIAGKYTLHAFVDNNTIVSEPFEIKNETLAKQALPLLLNAFQLQRCKPPFNDKDKAMSFYGDRTDVVDVSGGWYDASGEKGKYLSHLSFSNYMTPQQLPMMVWNMLEAYEVLTASKGVVSESYLRDLLAEAVYGADYLVRINDEEGYFYATIFAAWTKDPEQRQICAYEGQDGQRNDRYQAAFREGGGMAIAALARCAAYELTGEYASKEYLTVAENGYAHLKANNLTYCDDGQENIIDDYCALLAAVELYNATAKSTYLDDSRQRANSLADRLMTHAGVNNWLRADALGERPYFHGAEAGLPIIAMAHYLTVETDEKQLAMAKDFIEKSVQFELAVTAEVNNPFGYARQYVKAVNETEARTAFFIPHKNETGYWWQGENARIASLATAMFKAQNLFDEQLKSQVQAYAFDQINWVMGLNPYNVCMLHGAGRNNPDYKEGGESMNYLGGICNGITAGFDDENDIAFRPEPYDHDPAQRWRWSEQWLQHGGWMIPAIAYASK